MTKTEILKIAKDMGLLDRRPLSHLVFEKRITDFALVIGRFAIAEKKLDVESKQIKKIK